MTYWWSSDNYGQLLQCFALQQYLRNVGFDVYLIRYYPRSDVARLSMWKKILKIFDPVMLKRYFVYRKRKVFGENNNRDNLRGFASFRDKHIRQSEKIYYSYKELIENPPIADVYIVGSDQVWNTFGTSIHRGINRVNAFLLNFGDSSIKRISYAASFGKTQNELGSDFVEVFTPLLQKFNYVSVREISGLEICKLCGIDDAEWVPDPTVLLDAEAYRFLYDAEQMVKKTNKPYCFLYLVGNQFTFPVQAIYNWAKKKKIEIVYIAGNWRQDKHEKTYATIPEWIYLLEHAEYVLTNSFHATIFSLLFRKNFCIIPSVGEGVGMNSRFDSLFQLFGIENRFVNTDFSIFDESIDWQVVSNTFQQLRNTCKLSTIIMDA